MLALLGASPEDADGDRRGRTASPSPTTTRPARSCCPATRDALDERRRPAARARACARSRSASPARSTRRRWQPAVAPFRAALARGRPSSEPAHPRLLVRDGARRSPTCAPELAAALTRRCAGARRSTALHDAGASASSTSARAGCSPSSPSATSPAPRRDHRPEARMRSATLPATWLGRRPRRRAPADCAPPRAAAIAGLGHALPRPSSCPTAPIAERIGVDDAWIVQAHRHPRAPPPRPTTSASTDLAIAAGRRALADAGVDAARRRPRARRDDEPADELTPERGAARRPRARRRARRRDRRRRRLHRLARRACSSAPARSRPAAPSRVLLIGAEILTRLHRPRRPPDRRAVRRRRRRRRARPGGDGGDRPGRARAPTARGAR